MDTMGSAYSANFSIGTVGSKRLLFLYALFASFLENSKTLMTKLFIFALRFLNPRNSALKLEL